MLPAVVLDVPALNEKFANLGFSSCRSSNFLATGQVCSGAPQVRPGSLPHNSHPLPLTQRVRA